MVMRYVTKNMTFKRRDRKMIMIKFDLQTDWPK
jgi:hypothetical protein